MKVIENFVHDGTIYKIGMDFPGSPTDELLPFLENSSADIQDEKVLEESEIIVPETVNESSSEINNSVSAEVLQSKKKSRNR
ncbi:MAG: hypothetical protein IPM32_14310 [Ignavibacteriae bacterium]|nr:hypothetical protein [Ignavibacteriota bacterium]